MLNQREVLDHKKSISEESINEVFRRVSFPSLAPAPVPQLSALDAAVRNDHPVFISVDDIAGSISHGVALVIKGYELTGLHALCVTARPDSAHLMALQGAVARAPFTIPRRFRTAEEVDKIALDKKISAPHLLITDFNGFMQIRDRDYLQRHFSCLVLDSVDRWVTDAGISEELQDIRSGVASLYRLRVLGCGVGMSDRDLRCVNSLFNPDLTKLTQAYSPCMF